MDIEVVGVLRNCTGQAGQALRTQRETIVFVTISGQSVRVVGK